MTIDIHAHYVPAELIARIRSSKAFGVNVIDGAHTPALTFEYGFSVRPFFPKLVEDVRQRIAWLDGEKIDYQLVATWPDIYGYGLSDEECVAWHRLLNDTLTAWCNDNAKRFGFIASVPLPNAANAAAELTRAIGLGASGLMVPANVEGTNIGELPATPSLFILCCRHRDFLPAAGDQLRRCAGRLRCDLTLGSTRPYGRGRFILTVRLTESADVLTTR